MTTFLAPYLMTLLILAATLTPAAYAKGKPDNPGKSGDVLGQSTSSNTPGNSGNAPGQSENSPGNSGNAPGQIKKEERKVAADTPQVKNERHDSLEDFLGSDKVRLRSSFARSIISNSEAHEKLKTEMEVILLAYETGLITKDDAETRAKKCLDKIREINESGKFLGFLFHCNKGLLCR